MVSCSVSPLLTLDEPASEKPMMRPPMRLIAVSKLSRVRVEGSKNNDATTFPSSNFWFGFFSKSAASSIIRRYSALLKSVIEIKLFLFILYECLMVCSDQKKTNRKQFSVGFLGWH